MKKGLVIYGATSLARLAHYYASHDMGLRVVGFVVDAQYKTSDSIWGTPLYSWDEFITVNRPESVDLFVAIGYKSMKQRSLAYERVKQSGYRLVNIIAKSAFIADTVTMGDNNFIMPGAVVEPGVRLGSNNTIWSNATICHDTRIGCHNFFASNVTVGGEVIVGDRNFVGFSAVIIQNRKVPDDVLIGAQSLLLRDAENLSLYFGSPARKMGEIDAQTGVCVE